MNHGTNQADESVHPTRTRRDRGVTFIEILVAIVLLGTVGIGVLTAMRASVIGTRIERDHARAFQWLQSADGVLQGTDRVGCGDYDPDIHYPTYSSAEEWVRLQYQNTIRSEVVNPPGWEDSQISVAPSVMVWDGTQYWDPYDPLAPAECFDDVDRFLQLVTLEVASPDGDIIETIQVVKRD